MTGREPAGWRKSTFSINGNCVEWQIAEDVVRVRHSGDVAGPTLTFTSGEWCAFVRAVRDGQANLVEG